jgi:hypothetical protein
MVWHCDEGPVVSRVPTDAVCTDMRLLLSSLCFDELRSTCPISWNMGVMKNWLALAAPVPSIKMIRPSTEG